MVKHLYTFVNPVAERDITEVCRVLEAGGVIAYPSDVNWAFGCDVADVKALDRLRYLKPLHPKEQPFSLVCASIAMAAAYVNVDDAAYRILKRILPGPYTILLERNRNVPRQIKDNRKVIGIRIPAAPLIAAVVSHLGRPIVTTSVPAVSAFSPSGNPEPPRFGYQVIEAFGHGLDLLVDLGEEMPAAESSILDFTTDPHQVVREGAGPVDMFLDG